MKHFISFIFIVFLFSCSMPQQYQNVQKSIPSATDLGIWGEMFTAKHDGHLFVVYNSKMFIHHPSCPCTRNKTNE